MPRPRTGSITPDPKRGGYTVRVTYHDENGKRRDIRRNAGTKSEANRLLDQLKRDLKDGGAKSIDADRLTFQKLADIYTEERLVEPVYRGGDKVAGLRSWQDQRRRLKGLCEHFGKRLIKSITFADLESYKTKRLHQPTHKGTETAIATINRELALLRSVFVFAKQSGWLLRSPFEQGKAIISTAIEAKRERILSREEEARLLAACEDRERRHIRPLLIAALDTGARRGELLGLCWRDVDLENGLLTVKSFKGKKTTTRTVGMTARLRAELQQLFDLAPLNPDGLVFGIKAGFFKAFHTACQKAGIEDFRFHDCRHTAITRMVQSKMPHTEIMKLSGHTQFATFARYVNTTEETARRGADALDNLSREFEEMNVSEFVN